MAAGEIPASLRGCTDMALLDPLVRRGQLVRQVLGLLVPPELVVQDGLDRQAQRARLVLALPEQLDPVGQPVRRGQAVRLAPKVSLVRRGQAERQVLRGRPEQRAQLVHQGQRVPQARQALLGQQEQLEQASPGPLARLVLPALLGQVDQLELREPVKIWTT